MPVTTSTGTRYAIALPAPTTGQLLSLVRIELAIPFAGRRKPVDRGPGWLEYSCNDEVDHFRTM